MPPLQIVASPVRDLLLPSASSAARRIFVKCDELAQLVAPCSGVRSGITGVKARKLAALASQRTFPRHIVSHGGCQSNMMLALARLVRARDADAQLHYCCPRPPTWLARTPRGNFAQLQSLERQGRARVHTLPHKTYASIFAPGGSCAPPIPARSAATSVDDRDYTALGAILGLPDLRPMADVGWAGADNVSIEKAAPRSLFVPQGGAFAGAQAGVSQLGDEILAWWHARCDSSRRLEVFVAAGTGTTALMLARHFARHCPEATSQVHVVAVPCVGGENVLTAQIDALARTLPELETSKHASLVTKPFIVPAPELASRTFAAPCAHVARAWVEMLELGITADLIYAPVGWLALRRRAAELDAQQCHEGNVDIMFLNCGGWDGVWSQLERYERQDEGTATAARAGAALAAAAGRRLAHDLCT